MEHRNHTIVTEFILQGYPSSKYVQIVLFFVFLLIYIFTIASNILIILSIRDEPHLHSPMYYFLSHFSFAEVCYISTTVPKMLFDLLKEHKRISTNGCRAQLYFFMSLGLTEDFLLTNMALDRYLAICRPLHYNSLMSHAVCKQLTVTSYVTSFLVALVPVVWMSTLSFCFPNGINHFFCDFTPVLKLSCSNASLIGLTLMTIAYIIFLFCSLTIVVSYILIIITVMKIPTTTGRKKAFSTCGSHLMVVTIFYGTMMFMYIRPAGAASFSFDKVVSVFYAVIVPFVNPLIYSLRNKEMKLAMHRVLNPLLRPQKQ